MDNEPNNTSPFTPTLAPPNPHILWRQLLGLAFWVGVGSFFVGGPLGLILGLLLGGLTFADAWTSGIYKQPGKIAFTNMSPMGWGIAMTLLLVVGYPTYVMNRNKLRRIQGTNAFYWAVIVLGGLVIVVSVLGITARFMIRRS
jgi:ABC-type antimicrobial peptide transport system permease subunit